MNHPYALLLLLALLLGCDPAPASAPTPESASQPAAPVMNEPDSLLRHAVFFKFKDSATPAQIDTVRRAFSALPAQIDAIHDYEWGTNNSPEGLDKGFTHAFFVTFRSEDDRATYLPHPAHQAFVEVLKPHLEDVFVLDYWTRTD